RDEAGELRRHHDLQRELGLGAEWLTPRQGRELEPGLVPTFAGGGLAPRGETVAPRGLALARAAALRAAGGELRTGTEVVDGLWDGERLVGVRTAPAAKPGGVRTSGRYPTGSANAEDGGHPVEVYGDAVVLCNGAWSGQTAWLPDEARPPVRPVK